MPTTTPSPAVTATPGPWEYLPFDCRIVHQRCDHGAQEIAWSDADYRLIAAAPELRDALAALLAHVDTVKVTPAERAARALLARLGVSL